MMSIRRLAALLKVSTATVSMALQDHPKISAATRRRVHAAARRVRYKPNAKVAELMGQIRLSGRPRLEACLGVISFYETQQPWTKSDHLSRMYAGMKRRAEALGYRLEPFWLRGPGITPRRLSNMLDARGVEGLLCFGSPLIDETLPPEFEHFAIVTQGWSIKAPLHRIVNHGHKSTWAALEKIHALQYRRPGLIIGSELDVRSSHANASAYVGWCEHALGNASLIPILRVAQVDPGPFLEWLKQYRPDVILFVHDYHVLHGFAAMLSKFKIRVPQDIGVVAVTQLLEGTRLCGLEENQSLMGECAVELLISRIINNDFGVPRHPRIEIVESVWVEGKSLRRSPV